MQEFIKIAHKTRLKGNVQLPASKSISNRLLVINALSGNKIKINNLSTANDTRLLANIFAGLQNTTYITEINCHDAGTVMRFLTAYFTITPGQWLLIGTERMHSRPIGILVEKLKELGADIKYLANEGFPPLLISGKRLQGRAINIDASVSSQYISALMMVAPYLQNGLSINLQGKISSLPYIEMTAGLMQQCGTEVKIHDNAVIVSQGNYTSTELTVESDWSGASYWYAMAAVAKQADIELLGLQPNSLQGDSVLAQLMEPFGIQTHYTPHGVQLIKTQPAITNFEYDFTHCPDLAPTFVVLCAAMAIPARFYGMESLAIKESNRTAALATELNKTGVIFIQKDDYWELIPNRNIANLSTTPEFETYGDHRLAMAFTILSFVLPEIIINNPNVVIKSYPSFWSDFEART